MKLLTQALDHHATTRGHQLALRFLETGDVDGLKCELTYAEFREQAQKIAWNLQQKVEPGERVLLLYDGGMEFVLGFYGCLYAGIIAVPTGIVTAELAKPTPISTRSCPGCSASGHDPDAQYCKYCGTEL